MPQTAQDTVRDILFHATALIPDETVAGFVFGLGLVVTDHIFNLRGKFGASPSGVSAVN